MNLPKLVELDKEDVVGEALEEFISPPAESKMDELSRDEVRSEDVNGSDEEEVKPN